MMEGTSQETEPSRCLEVEPDNTPTLGKGQHQHQPPGKGHDPDHEPRLTPNGLLEDKEGGVGGGGGIMDSGIAGDDCCSTREEDWVGATDDMASSCEEELGGQGLNGDIFSPDSADMVTIICATTSGDGGKERRLSEPGEEHSGGGGGGRGAGGGGEGSDTHSDSIETLEEEEGSPQGVGSQDGLSDSLLQQMCLTNTCREGEGEEDGAGKRGVVGARVGGESSLDSSQEEEDSMSTDSHEVIPDSAVFDSGTGTGAVSRPESLSLLRPLLQQQSERNRSCSEPQGRAQVMRAEASGHQRTRSEAMIDINTSVRLRGIPGYGDDLMSRSLPHGTLTRKGVLVEFVADDLTEKIKRSSPMSTAESSSLGSRRSSQRSLASTSSVTSSGMSRSPSSLLTQSPDTAPPIDPAAIMELELAARRVADNVDHMMGNLRNNLHKMSAITVGCSEAYKTSVDITCESVDSSIKSMYALMAKCEELSKTMTPVYQIGTQIKEIKRLLDRFEAQLSEKP